MVGVAVGACVMIGNTPETRAAISRGATALNRREPERDPHMPLDSDSSDRLASLRFPLIVGVVFIHAYSTEVRLSHSTVGIEQTPFVLDLIRNLLSQGIARIAVPTFFLMSGYFFFLDFSWSVAAYKAKLSSRGRTLLIPYLFWNTCGFLAILAAQNLPATRPFFAGSMPDLPSLGVWDRIDATIGITRLPILYQFWFIRDLMVLVVLSPLFYVFLRVIPSITLGAISIAWFLGAWFLTIPTIEALAFFLIGAGCAMAGKSLFAFDRFGIPITIAYLGVLLSDALTKGSPLNPYLHKSGILLGIPCTLFLTHLVVDRPRLKGILLWLGRSSFFVFATHEPLMTGIRKIVFKLLSPSSQWLVLVLYLVIPSLLIALLVLVYAVFKKLFPRFASWVTGGR